MFCISKPSSLFLHSGTGARIVLHLEMDHVALFDRHKLKSHFLADRVSMQFTVDAAAAAELIVIADMGNTTAAASTGR